MENYVDEDFSIKIEDGIVFIVFFREHADFGFVDKGVKKRIEMTEGRPYPIITDMRKIKSATREARIRISEADAGAGCPAVAVIVNSKLQKVMYNLYNAIFRAPAPCRLFTERKDALEWIQQFKHIHN
jgi:hypothetical protein